MVVTVNNQRVQVDEDATVAALLNSLGYPNRGVARSR